MADTNGARLILITALVLLTTCTVSTAQPEDKPDKIPHPKDVAYIQSKVQCDNAEEVALRVFGEGPDPGLAQGLKPFTQFETQDLGDGTTCYIFLPPGGAGRFAAHPRYHFLKEDGELRLIVDHNGLFAQYHDESAKYNGKYLFSCGGLMDSKQGKKGEPTRERGRNVINFWNGDGYQRAYMETTHYEVYPDRVDEVGTTFEWWDPLGKGAFLNAHVTWEHKVGPSDTLSELSSRYRTEMAAVMAQNGIKDPGKLTTGQRIIYDSKKNPDGKHHGIGEPYTTE